MFFSCEYFSEQEDINYRFYINSGWFQFEQGNYSEAKTYFYDAVDLFEGNNSENITEAYLGLGWSNIYYANNLPGNTNFELREECRIDAEINFGDALNIYSEEDIAQEIYYDALFGEIVMLSYHAIKSEVVFFNNPADSAFWNKMITNSELVLSKSEELLLIDSEYNFSHDENIDVTNILILRAQTYVRLHDVDSAWIEVNEISVLPNECSGEDRNIYECLDLLHDW